MLHILNLLAAIALLVFGTHTVRTGMLRVMGGSLRNVLARATANRIVAAGAGVAVTALVQSSTATGLIASSFVGRGLMTLAAALAVMLGADVGTALMVGFFSLDLSWLSPLLIFIGVVGFIGWPSTTVGRVGRVLIGLGLIVLALDLIFAATQPLMASPNVRLMLGTLTSDVALDIFVGALVAVASYSSLAAVLMTATLAQSGVVPVPVAFGLVLGANLGSGVLALLTNLGSPLEARRVVIGNLMFKATAVLAAAPFIGLAHDQARLLGLGASQSVVLLHIAFNLAVAFVFIFFTRAVAGLLERAFPAPAAGTLGQRPRHLDPVALATPTLAIGCAAREALHQADVVETMLKGLMPVIRGNDLELAERLRKMDDQVDELYTDIKIYLTKISREALRERESRRWTDIISFTINMEQIGDIVERILTDVEDRLITPRRQFSQAGLAEIEKMHAHLLDNLRLGMSVFLDGNVRDARRLLEEKARFRDLERQFAQSHLGRLQENTLSSMETSSLHLDLISDLKRINSHICSIAYPILESAGALSNTRLRTSRLMTDEFRETR